MHLFKAKWKLDLPQKCMHIYIYIYALEYEYALQYEYTDAICKIAKMHIFKIDDIKIDP